MNSSNTNTSKNTFEKMPIALAAISLGFMSISTALVDLGISWLRPIAVLFSVVCLFLILVKVIKYPKTVRNELQHPLLGSIYPTIFMTLMVIAVYVVQFSKPAAQILWLFAIISHFLISAVFFIERFKNFKLIDLIPSWFIPTVGMGVASVTSKPMALPQVANIVFYYSLILFVVVGLLMLYRIFAMEKLEGPKRPTLMIMSAPANICLASYIAISESPNKALISALAVVGYITIVWTYLLLPKLIKAKALPALAPLTFPLAIGVIACQRYVKYLGKIGSPLQGMLNAFVYVQIVIALVVILYVVYKSIAFLIESFSNKEELKLQSN